MHSFVVKPAGDQDGDVDAAGEPTITRSQPDPCDWRPNEAWRKSRPKRTRTQKTIERIKKTNIFMYDKANKYYLCVMDNLGESRQHIRVCGRFPINSAAGLLRFWLNSVV